MVPNLNNPSLPSACGFPDKVPATRNERPDFSLGDQARAYDGLRLMGFCHGQGSEKWECVHQLEVGEPARGMPMGLVF